MAIELPLKEALLVTVMVAAVVILVAASVGIYLATRPDDRGASLEAMPRRLALPGTEDMH